ncbi:MAG: hypothetical protein NNA25_11230 [Nitrospira sp.]|nr:hypothetical protein [Nitrospira sp.]
MKKRCCHRDATWKSSALGGCLVSGFLWLMGGVWFTLGWGGEAIGSLTEAGSAAHDGRSVSATVWSRLIAEADRLRLPTTFLKQMPEGFVRFAFEDLRTYAAEYHPGDHRMVLNRSLSFNGAGAVLKPLRTMTSQELQVLYHELFHAYMDYLTTLEEQGKGTVPELLQFARRQQRCRYGQVAIAPLVQRPHDTEVRYLTESESWEALNETWAIFVGWMIWNHREIHTKHGTSREHHDVQWAERLKTAFSHGEFRGYYVPLDVEEQRIAPKRFLGQSSQLTWGEAEVLLLQVIGFPEKMVMKLKRISGLSNVSERVVSC